MRYNIKDRAIHACQDACVRSPPQRRRRKFSTSAALTSTTIRGRNDWIVGNLAASRRDGDRDRFEFSCSTDFDNGRIRSINVNRSDRR